MLARSARDASTSRAVFIGLRTEKRLFVFLAYAKSRKTAFWSLKAGITVKDAKYTLRYCRQKCKV